MVTSKYPGGVHPFADLFPMLVGEEYANLQTDIEEHGLREPITVTQDGTLVDGRNRWQACEDLGIKPEFETLPPETTEVQILDLIMSRNVHRRHLDTTDRTRVALNYKDLLEKAVRQGQRTDLTPTEVKLPAGERRPQTTERAAKMAGVGQSTLERAVRVERDEPELAEQMWAKEITINKADEERAARQAGKRAPVKEPTRGGSTRSTSKQVMAMLGQLGGVVHATEILGPSIFSEGEIKEFSEHVSALNSFRRKLTNKETEE